MASLGKKLAIGAGVVAGLGAIAIAATAAAEEEEEKKNGDDFTRPDVDPGFESACRAEGGTVSWNEGMGDWVCTFPDGTVVAQADALGPQPPPIEIGAGVVVKPGDDVALDAGVDLERIWFQLPYEALEVSGEGAEVVEQIGVGEPGDVGTMADPYLGTLFVRWRILAPGPVEIKATNLNTQETYIAKLNNPIRTAQLQTE